MIVEIKGDRPEAKGEATMMRADNESAVAWVKKCRGWGSRDARLGALTRGRGENRGGKSWLHTRHFSGVENILTDGITRWGLVRFGS